MGGLSLCRPLYVVETLCHRFAQNQGGRCPHSLKRTIGLWLVRLGSHLAGSPQTAAPIHVRYQWVSTSGNATAGNSSPDVVTRWTLK